MKQTDTHVSDEILNAMLDGELDDAEFEALRERLARDPELNRRAKELMRLKQLVRMARPESPAEVSPPAAPRLRLPLVARAALIVLLLGGAIFGAWQWGAGPPLPPAPPLAEGLAALRVQLEATSASRRVIVHTRRGDEAAMRALLEELDGLLTRVRGAGGEVQVELVADGPGLTLLRADASPVASRIRAMKSRHANLVFVACNHTRSKVERESGRPVPLLPQAVLVPSVQEKIAQRTRQGWSYVAV